MKNKNENNRLVFNKLAVTELNDNQMYDVDGGTSPACIWAAVESFAATIGIYTGIKALLAD